MSVDVVLHGELVRTQEQLEQLRQDIVAARQEIAQVRQTAENTGVKRVLRGTAYLYTSNDYQYVEIPVVNQAKSVLTLVGYTGTAESGSYCRLSFYGAKILINTTKQSEWTYVEWQLVEYY